MKSLLYLLHIVPFPSKFDPEWQEGAVYKQKRSSRLQAKNINITLCVVKELESLWKLFSQMIKKKNSFSWQAEKETGSGWVFYLVYSLQLAMGNSHTLLAWEQLWKKK